MSDTTPTDIAEQIAEKAIPPLPITTATKAFVGAIVGGLTAGGAALVSAIADNTITGGEWVTIIAAIAISALGTGGSVYGATNKLLR